MEMGSVRYRVVYVLKRPHHWPTIARAGYCFDYPNDDNKQEIFETRSRIEVEAFVTGKRAMHSKTADYYIVRMK